MNLNKFQQYFEHRVTSAPVNLDLSGEVFRTHIGKFRATDDKLAYRPEPNAKFTESILFERVIEYSADYFIGEPVVKPNLELGTVTLRSARSREVQRVRVDNQWYDLSDIRPAVSHLHPGLAGGNNTLREYMREILNSKNELNDLPVQPAKALGWNEPVQGLLFGSDLEVFVRDTRSGKIVPAPLLVPGTKQSPVELTKGTVHPDGIAVEVGCPPSDTYEGLKANLEAILDEVKQKFFPEAHFQYIKGSHEASAADIQDFEKHREENPSWFISGCAPEYMMGSDSCDAYIKSKQRCTDKFFTGLHIHYGFTSWENIPMSRLDGQAFQSKVWHSSGVSVAMAELTGIAGRNRVQYYGGVGAFRIKPYGVEDRSLQGDAFFRDEYQDLIKALIKQASTVIKGVL